MLPKEVGNGDFVERVTSIFLISLLWVPNQLLPDRRLAVFGGFKSGIGASQGVNLTKEDHSLLFIPSHPISKRSTRVSHFYRQIL